MPHVLPLLHQASPSFSACAVHQQSWFSGWLVGGRVLPLPCCLSLSFCAQEKGPYIFLEAGRKLASTASLVFLPSSPPCPLPISSISTSDHSEGLQSLGGSPHSVHLPRCLLARLSWAPALSSFCSGGNAGSCCWMCSHSVCFLIAPSTRGERAVPMKPALCGPSPPSAEGLRRPYASPCQHLPPQQLRADNSGTSLVVQWLRICLPVQGTWVPSLFGELRSHMKVKVAQLCLTLCNPMDCSLPGFSVCGILQTRILKWCSRSLLQGIFPTQGWNRGLLNYRQIR